MVLGAAADPDRTAVEHEAAPEEARLLGINHHEAVVPFRDPLPIPEGLLHDGCDSSFLLRLAHALGLTLGMRGRGRADSASAAIFSSVLNKFQGIAGALAGQGVRPRE